MHLSSEDILSLKSHRVKGETKNVAYLRRWRDRDRTEPGAQRSRKAFTVKTEVMESNVNSHISASILCSHLESASLGLVCLIISTCVNEWKTHGYTDGGMLKSFMINTGLWMECKVPSNGKWECEVFDSILHLPKDVQVTRAMMIISITLSVCGLVVAMLGMKCTLCLDEDEQVKNKVAFTGGILITLAGVCALGVVSWYAHGVVTTFNDPRTQAFRFSLGKCLFLGWGGALLSIIGGAPLVCCSLSRSSSGRRYTSQPPVQMDSGKEYV